MAKSRRRAGGRSSGKGRGATGGSGSSAAASNARVPHPIEENQQPPPQHPEPLSAAAVEAEPAATAAEEGKETEAAQEDAALAEAPEDGAKEAGGNDEETDAEMKDAAVADDAPGGKDTPTGDAGAGAQAENAAKDDEKGKSNEGKDTAQEDGAADTAAEEAEAAAEAEGGSEPPAKKQRSDSTSAAAAAAAAEQVAKTSSSSEDTNQAAATAPSSHDRTPQIPPNLILTAISTKRSLYECDYCKNDITHVPRIRCAVCPDFDLCLDCFGKGGGGVGSAKAATAGSSGSGTGGDGGKDDGPPELLLHDAAVHGYRVSDSARFPVLATARGVKRGAAGGRGADDDGSGGDAGDKKPAAAQTDADGNADANEAATTLTWTDEPRAVWTAEEDLRLLDAISIYGLGNWADVAEAVAGQHLEGGGSTLLGGSSHGGGGGGGGGGSSSSSHKSAKRCMERYLDDFLGRYGHILPPYTLVEETAAAEDGNGDEDSGSGATTAAAATTAVAPTVVTRPSLSRQASTMSAAGAGFATGRKYRVVPTESLPGYDQVWPHPHLPDVPNSTTIKIGDEVGRDLAVKAEQEFVKTASATDQAEAARLRHEWMEKRLFQPGGPTVLPMRVEDIKTMPGSELAGYMPRRGDFDVEWENDAETILAEMEFSADDAPQDRQLKLQIIEIYNEKLAERERRKNFLIERKLLNYRQNQANELLLPPDERDLVNRMRLFARFHSAEEHEKFIADLLKAKRLRKEIARLQQYRRMGIQTLTEAEKYELDRDRREHHKVALEQKEADDAAKAAAASATSYSADHTTGPTLWKEYGSDRRNRKSVNRGASAEASDQGDDEKKPASSGGEEEPTKMDIDADDADKKKPAASSSEPSAATKSSTFHIDNMTPGYNLLSSKEIKLCKKLELLPEIYLEAKKALIAESFRAGIIEDDATPSASGGIKPSKLVKIDVEKRDGVIDFIVKAGWIPRPNENKPSNAGVGE